MFVSKLFFLRLIKDKHSIMTQLKTLLFCFLLLVLISCNTKTTPTFSISGTVLNTTQDFAILSKVEDVINNKTTVIDTLTIDSKGNFNAEYNLEPNIYTLTLDAKKTLFLAIEKNQNIEITGSNLDSLTINGSTDTDLLKSYETFRKASLKRLVLKVRDSIKKIPKENAAQIEQLRALEIENYNIHLFELTSFIQKNMGTSIAIYPTSIRWNSDNLTALEEIVAGFKTAHPTSEITNKLENRIALLQKMAIGNTISAIEMPSINNEIINLNIVKGTVTLIDFWASWCPPCRAESRLLNELYKNYKTKGFEIFGISLDSKRQRWLDAIEKDQRTWINVSTVEGFKTPIAQEYGITALPTNIIIDGEGKIIAANIHGKQLKETIDKLFE